MCGVMWNKVNNNTFIELKVHKLCIKLQAVSHIFHSNLACLRKSWRLVSYSGQIERKYWIKSVKLEGKSSNHPGTNLCLMKITAL